MNKRDFWGIVDRVKPRCHDADIAYEGLFSALYDLDYFSLLRWHCILLYYDAFAKKEKVSAMAYVVNGAGTEAFTAFRGWLILQGLELYLMALRTPKQFSLHAFGDRSEKQFDEIFQVAPNVFFQKFWLHKWEPAVFRQALVHCQPSAWEIAELWEDISYDPQIDASWCGRSIYTYLPELCEQYGMVQ